MSKFVMFGLSLAMALSLAPGLSAQVELADAGVTVIVSDAIVADQGVAMNSYWEPFTDVFGDGTIAVIAGVHGLAEDGIPITESQNAMVAFLRPGSTEFEEYWAFYGDDSLEPYTANFNSTRTDGNPPRIAVDRRPGGTRYCVGLEATAWDFEEFTLDRWVDPFLFDAQHPACQLHNLTPDGPVPITNVFDGLYGDAGGLVGEQGGQQMRFGGDMRFLSNGNLVVCPEDRSGNIVAGNAAVCRIYNGETGAPLTDQFIGRMDGTAGSIWSNVAAYDGGFMIRASGQLTTFDNDGNAIAQLSQADLSVVSDLGRSDGARIGSSIGSQSIFLAGKDGLGDVWLTKINAVTGETVTEVLVSEEFFIDLQVTFDHVDVACDENDNVCVQFSVQFAGVEERDNLARIFNSDLEPVTDTFHTFTTHNSDEDGYLGFRGDEGNCSMDTERIVLAANGQVAVNEAGELSPLQSTIVTVLESPFKVSVSDWQLW
jgi:hypothetical protein